MKRSANVVWKGDLKAGKGTISTASGAMKDAAYGFATRFEEQPGTNPEELIAAAHATCVSMALANGLAQAGTPATKLESDATATFDQTSDGFRLTTMRLSVRGQVDGLDEEGFRAAAEDAKENCPVSQALKNNVELSVNARLAASVGR